MERLGLQFGLPLTGYALGLRGHIATLVETPAGRVVLDGMHGLFYHTLDNKRLATLDEMRAAPDIALRMWATPRAHGHEFFHGNALQTIRRWKDRHLHWPLGVE